MKSLPEKKFWNSLRNRLRNYSEEPDDSWNLIAARIPAKKNSWIDVGGHLFTAISLLSLLFLIQPGHSLDRPRITADLSNELSGSPSSGKSDNKNSASASNNSDKASMQNDRNRIPRSDGMPEGKNVSPDFSTDLGTTGKSIFSGSSVNVARSIGTEKMEASSKEASGRGNENDSNATRDEIGADPAISSEGDSTYKNENQISSSGVIGTENHEMQASAGSHAYRDVIAEAKRDSVQAKSMSKKTLSDSVRVTTKSKDEKRKQPWLRPTIYFTVTPSLAYYKITPDRKDDLLVTRIHKQNLISGDRFGIQLDAGIQHSISKSFDVFAGFSWYSQELSISYDYLSDDVEKVESSGNLRYTLSPSEVNRRFSFSMKNAGITAGVFYVLKDSRLSHRFGGGLQYQKSGVTYQDETRREKSSRDFLTYMLLYRMQISFTKKLNWFVQPSFSHAILPYQVSQGSMEIKPYRVGIGTGILYRF
jgi:hypothetical protein